ncbi:MAG: ATP-binding cassette domain-containing protein [Coprococcus sp.]
MFALDHAEFGVEKGEIVVILGPSGSGKSTLLNILGGLDKLTEGSMLVDGTNLEKMSAKELELYRRGEAWIRIPVLQSDAGSDCA